MPPLPDALISYQPAPVTAAASRIVQAYLGNHRLSATEAAKLAMQVETVLARLLAGDDDPAPTAARASRDIVPATAPRGRGAAAKRARPPVAFEETVEADEDESEDAFEDESLTETAEAAAAETAPAFEPESEPEPALRPVVKAPEPVQAAAAIAEEETEIDLLTGGPLPRAAAGSDFAQEGFLPPAPTGPRKRKRPPRPASKRRARQRDDQDSGEG